MTDEEAKVLLIAETGAEDYPEIEATYFDLYWASHSGEHQRLQTRIDILRYIRGQLRRKVNITVGRDRIDNQQLFKNVSEMLTDDLKELKEVDPDAYVASMLVTQATSSLPNSVDEIAEKLGEGTYEGIPPTVGSGSSFYGGKGNG